MQGGVRHSSHPSQSVETSIQSCHLWEALLSEYLGVCLVKVSGGINGLLAKKLTREPPLILVLDISAIAPLKRLDNHFARLILVNKTRYFKLGRISGALGISIQGVVNPNMISAIRAVKILPQLRVSSPGRQGMEYVSTSTRWVFRGHIWRTNRDGVLNIGVPRLAVALKQLPVSWYHQPFQGDRARSCLIW